MAKNYLVVDVGGTKILGAVLNENGDILSRHKLKTNRGDRAALLSQLDEAFTTVLNGAGLTEKEVAGMALGVPGVVDSTTGHVVSTPNAPLSDTPLVTLLSKKWDCPVIVGNDVNIGMAGEVWLGGAKNAESAFGIFVGTGVGGALFMNGHLVEGYRGLGGEIGHVLFPVGIDKKTGAKGREFLHLEELCSRTAIENQLRHAITVENRKSILSEIVGDKKLERIRSGALKDALKKGDPLTVEVIKNASYFLGLCAASVIHLVDPKTIVFGGGVIEACGKWMIPEIQRAVDKVIMKGNGMPVEIAKSKLGDDAILIGGLSLLLQKEGTFKSELKQPKVFASVDKPLGSGT
jgi:glucokinase